MWSYKPDENPGWLFYFLQKGHRCYVVDLPGVGRSRNQARFLHQKGNVKESMNISSISPQACSRDLVFPEAFAVHPASAYDTARLHDKWPGVSIACLLPPPPSHPPDLGTSAWLVYDL